MINEPLNITVNRPNIGSQPGLLEINPLAIASKISVVTYEEHKLKEYSDIDINEVKELNHERGVCWIHIQGLGDLKVLTEIQNLFHLHPLAMEDVVNVHQRPKVEDYETYLFFIMRILKQSAGYSTEQISIFLLNNTVISFQETYTPYFEQVVKRVRKGTGRIRKSGTDYLVYALLDAIVDHSFPVLDLYSDELEDIEDQINEDISKIEINTVHLVRKHLVKIIRTLRPQRDAIAKLLKDDNELITDDTLVFIRDCYDHSILAIELAEYYREQTQGMISLYLSVLSNNMNVVMKTLSAIATIFLPLTFIVGIYGMNFDVKASPFNMPELSWQYGYPLIWVVMLSLTTGLLLFFKHKRWW